MQIFRDFAKVLSVAELVEHRFMRNLLIWTSSPMTYRKTSFP